MEFKPDYIFIASSTGGPQALELLLKKMETPLVPCFIVQHMPAKFTAMLADSLAKRCGKNVVEVSEETVIKKGQFYIAKGGNQMLFVREEEKVSILLGDEVGRFGLKPSADIFFNSAANAIEGSKLLIVVLTGMGDDGTEGIRVLKQTCECYTIVQDEASCIVYGMPKKVIEAGFSDEELPLEEIGARVNEIMENGLI